MKIAIIGYGKMGKEIEKIAISRGHTVSLIVDKGNSKHYTHDLNLVDVAIEFTSPQSVIDNINNCFEFNVPIVVGTTGWMDKLAVVKKNCSQKDQTLFFASNFSIGVNLFYKLNSFLANLMNTHPEYNVNIEEIHHIHKLDAPSGTAISLANQLMEELDTKSKWVNSASEKQNEISIISKRENEVPGTHTVSYKSLIDELTITHKANNREGFAIGAVIAAEWVIGKKGVFGMEDLLSSSKI